MPHFDYRAPPEVSTLSCSRRQPLCSDPHYGFGLDRENEKTQRGMGRGRVACPEDTGLCHMITQKEHCIFLQHTIYSKFALKSLFGVVMLTSCIEESLHNHT